MGKINMYDLLKIKIQDIIKSNYDLHIDSEQEYKHTIKQQDTPLFRQLAEIRGYDKPFIKELIFVEARHNKKRIENLKYILKEGFNYNNKHYVRFGKSNSQAKDGVTVFVQQDYFNELFERSQLGVNIKKCVISKYESYRCLIFSSCQFVNGKLPYIVIVDEYQKELKNQFIRYAVKKDTEIVDSKTRQTRVFKNQRVIEEGYRDIAQSPFDGFGIHTREISQRFGESITDKYLPIAYQIRLPFLKGMSIEAPFKEFYKENGIDKIKDIFGKWHKVEDIDCIWNTTMWKGASIFKSEFGIDAWNVYLQRVKKYKYQIGISKYSHDTEYVSPFARMNFQYLQCLDLINPKYINQFKTKDDKYDILHKDNEGKIISVAKYTTDLFQKIIKGDKLYTLKFLGINDTEHDLAKSKYIEAILINDEMLKDPTIKNMLRRKLSKAITQAKYGKIYTEGFYHTVVGDIVGYMEYCGGMEVKGCLNAHEFHVDTLPSGDCLSFRSPLVDPSEVNKIKLVTNNLTKKYLNHFKNQDVCMINMYDLTMQQQGGMDEDGDSVMLCRDKVLLGSRINKPIVVDIDDKVATDPVEYNIDNIVTYECNSRDSRIGEITNIATSILNQYTEDPTWRKINEDNVSLLRLYQGKEIDYLKTGFRWIISKNLRKYLKRLPFFILYNYPKKLSVYNKIKKINKENSIGDRIPYNAYRSPSPLNELCDYITQWERHNIAWDRNVQNNRDLVMDSSYDFSNKHILKNIKLIYDEFKLEFQAALECESDLNVIIDKYKEKILEITLEPYEYLANYCIYVAYRSISEDKVLCWSIFGDIMIENLRKNSDRKSYCKVISVDPNEKDAKEFLGRYYKLVEVEDDNEIKSIT